MILTRHGIWMWWNLVNGMNEMDYSLKETNEMDYDPYEIKMKWDQ